MKKETISTLETQKETMISNFQLLNPELYEQCQNGSFIRTAPLAFSVEVSTKEDRTNG